MFVAMILLATVGDSLDFDHVLRMFPRFWFLGSTSVLCFQISKLVDGDSIILTMPSAVLVSFVLINFDRLWLNKTHPITPIVSTAIALISQVTVVDRLIWYFLSKQASCEIDIINSDLKNYDMADEYLATSGALWQLGCLIQYRILCSWTADEDISGSPETSRMSVFVYTMLIGVTLSVLDNLCMAIWYTDSLKDTVSQEALFSVSICQLLVVAGIVLSRQHVLGGFMSLLERGQRLRSAVKIMPLFSEIRFSNEEAQVLNKDTTKLVSTGKRVFSTVSIQDVNHRPDTRNQTVPNPYEMEAQHETQTHTTAHFFISRGCMYGSTDAFVIAPQTLEIELGLRTFAVDFKAKHGRSPSFFSSTFATNMEGHPILDILQSLPVVAAGCQIALIVLSPQLFTDPVSLLQLLAALLVHWDPRRFKLIAPDGRVDRDIIDQISDCLHSMSIIDVIPLDCDESSSIDETAFKAKAALKAVVTCYGGDELLTNFLQRRLENVLTQQRSSTVDTEASVEQIQEQLVASLGLAQPMDIQHGEFGISLFFQNLATLNAVPTKLIETGTISMLLSLKLPSNITLRFDKARYSIFIDTNTIQVAIRRPSERDPKDDGALIDAISSVLTGAQLTVDGTNGLEHHMVMSIRKATPKRVPKVHSRDDVIRLEKLGSGEFADVYKAELSIKVGTSRYSQVVAAKTSKSADLTTRHDLLREAAMMALFDHDNVLTTLGIVIHPQDVPAMMLMPVCEYGTLLDYVDELEPSGANVVTQLEFCLQVCLGMAYLSSRHMIHRDLACRNVLLDSTLKCKISDFGMASMFEENDKSEYVRAQGMIPLRWSAIEVIERQRFLPQSDVWSFGVLQWEVFSYGSHPYSELDDIYDVAEYIINGGVLEQPEYCPDAVYTDVIKPCWVKAPEERPSFEKLSSLYCNITHRQSTISTSGENSAGMLIASSPSRETTIDDEAHKRRVTTGSIAGLMTLKQRSMLGPSVSHMSRVVLTGTIAGCRKRGTTFIDVPDEATIWHMVQVFAKPTSEATTCPRDGKRGAAYVDTLTSLSEVGRANALLSYSWGYKVTDVVDALEGWVTGSSRDSRRTRIWICSLCLNQHRMETTVTPEELANEFGPRVMEIGMILPMLDSWETPLYLTRAWCRKVLPERPDTNARARTHIHLCSCEIEYSSRMQHT